MMQPKYISYYQAALLLISANTLAANKPPNINDVKDPLVETIALELDLTNSSIDIIKSLSGGLTTFENMPKMTVNLYQSGKRVAKGTGQLPMANAKISFI